MEFRKSARTWAHLLVTTAVLCGSGATCQRPMVLNPFVPPGPAAPQVLAEGASRDQIIAAVNENSARIQSLTVTGATITIPGTLGLPILSGNIAAERPGRFRLTAGTAISGQEIDLGSNDELFWMWVRHNQPPAVYICRHDQFAHSSIRQIMPVEPKWLLAAMGMVDIDPANVFDGPHPHGNGTVELRTWLPSTSGNLQRVMVIDARRAWVVEQHVYDPSGKTLLASAVAESHQYLEPQQVSLPQRVAISLPTANLNFKIELGGVQVNQLTGDRQQLWTLPTFEGYPQYDLGRATPGTPLPGTAAMRTPYHVMPASYPIAPEPSSSNIGYSEYVGPSTLPHSYGAANASGATYRPLPQYGLRPLARSR